MDDNSADNSAMSKGSLNIDCSREQLMAYFKSVCKLVDENHDEFPVNLDDVWPLVYGRKQEAVRALVSNENFIEEIDYHTVRNDAHGGQFASTDYYLTISCFEFFIARKKRDVFEVYRQFFHKVRRGENQQPPLSKAERTLATIRQLCELAERDVELERKQIQLEQEQRAIANKVSEIEKIVKPNGFMSVMGFANIHHLNIGKNAAQSIGRLASKWCKRAGIIPEKTKHERYGSINTYPIDALKVCFGEFYPNMAL